MRRVFGVSRRAGIQGSVAVLLGALLLTLSACGGSSESRVVVAAGTSLVDSGFMGEVASAYSQVEPGVELLVVALSSGEGIAYADAGSADIIITHSREALDLYLLEHPESVREDVFSSTFFLVANPSVGLSVSSLSEALEKISVGGYLFASRDDGSGTNAAEVAAWGSAGLDPFSESWYIRTAAGMGATLQVANQRNAITLTEEGAFLASESLLDLEPVANTHIENPYDLTLVDPSGNSGAEEFFKWLTSIEGAEAIERANTDLFSDQVYEATQR